MSWRVAVMNGFLGFMGTVTGIHLDPTNPTHPTHLLATPDIHGCGITLSQHRLQHQLLFLKKISQTEDHEVMLKFNLDFMFSKSCLLEEGILRPKRKPLLTHIFDSRHLTMFSVIPLL
uniref:Follicular dendritic cell secreted peptide isoform X1 n=1 Tax=Phascolarctos cinereus TaxID=38626 RepID=A0A6P5KGN3_PHACI|nr:follicular dendritic cell secreted peptide isoform X1 [Phascolarctos cinereus]